LAKIPLEDTPIYAQLKSEERDRELYAVFFEEYRPVTPNPAEND
jgi:hypothetical protein